MNYHKKISVRWHLVLSVWLPLLWLSACDRNSSGGAPNPDTTAPTISSTTPANAATAVARNSGLTATFVEDIFAVTVDATSFTLATTSAAGNVPGSVSFDGASNVASLVPSAPLAILAPYTVTLSTAITDLSGNPLVTDYNWSFTTTDGVWGAPALIESDNVGGAFSPQIAFDNSGNAIAVWEQSDGSRYNIWANRFDGRDWGTAALLESDNAGAAFSPQIAFDNSGNAIAVWEQSDGSRYNIWVNRFDGSGWGTAMLLESDNTGHAGAPQIAVDNNGNAIAVWRQFDGSRYSIWANRFDGSGWSGAERLESDNTGNASAPQIAVDNNGNALAVWFQSDGFRNNIWANRFDGSGWGTAVLLESDNAGSAYAPQIAFDNSGNAIAVWAQYDGSRNNIWANRFDGSGWGTAALLESDNAGAASMAQIAVDNSGNAIAVWFQSDGTRNNIWANRFDGSGWGTAALLESDDAGDASFPQIAVGSSGNALAVWSQSDGSGYNIWANRFE